MAEKYPEVEKAISTYVAELRKHGISPQKVILFGSHATGTATPLSDIDLVVVSEDLAKWPALERLEMLSRLTVCVDAPLEVLGYTPEEIEKAGSDSILWGEIEKTGKVLVAA